MADFLPPGAVFSVSDAVMAKLSDTEAPQGIAAIVSSPRLVLDEIILASVPLLIACDRIQDPGNMGTIIRLADAVGADAVIVFPGCCDPFMPKAVRSSAGSIFHLPVVAAEMPDAAAYCRQREIALVAADVHAERDCFDADFRRSLAIVLGNEAHGISRGMKEYISEAVRIPIIGQAESLNVATSAAVLMYEAVRQRTEKLRGR
jgi:TrmH family RNA methyltransferase